MSAIVKYRELVLNSVKKLQIFGERCSGTNYLEQLINKNIPSISITTEYGFKHFFPKTDVGKSNDCLFIILYRNPFDWLKSIYRNPWHANAELKALSFSDFIRSKWICVWDKDAGVSKKDKRYNTEIMFERCPVSEKRFENLIKMRTAKILAWETIRDKNSNTVYIRYEELILDPEKHIRIISYKLDLPMTPIFKGVDSYKGLRWYQGLKTRILRKPLPIVNSDDLQYIVMHLDEQLENSVSYNIKSLLAEQSG